MSRKGNDIDLLRLLRAVMEQNTVSYRDDFELDEALLRAAAASSELTARTFCWMSRPHGTWCEREREVYLRGTAEHNIWTHYENAAHGIKAFRITVTGECGGVLYGRAHTLDYPAHVQRVKQTALPIVRVSGAYADGALFSVLYDALNSPQHREACRRHGGIARIEYHPESEWELRELLRREHSLQPKRAPASRTAVGLTR